MKKVSAFKKFFVLNIHRFLLNKIFKPFVNMNIKPLPFELIRGSKCLLIAPHPDDESIGCGGIMNLYPSCFDIVCLTHGNNSVRHEEFEKAMRIDPFLNALRCNYGYAVTCHKAQGGEWNSVFIQMPRNITFKPTKTKYQWFYTALTRAKLQVHLCKDFFIS